MNRICIYACTCIYLYMVYKSALQSIYAVLWSYIYYIAVAAILYSGKYISVYVYICIHIYYLCIHFILYSGSSEQTFEKFQIIHGTREVRVHAGTCAHALSAVRAHVHTHSYKCIYTHTHFLPSDTKTRTHMHTHSCTSNMACGKCVCSHALTGIRSSRRHLADIRKSQLVTQSSIRNDMSDDFWEIFICRALRQPVAHNLNKIKKSSLTLARLYCMYRRLHIISRLKASCRRLRFCKLCMYIHMYICM